MACSPFLLLLLLFFFPLLSLLLPTHSFTCSSPTFPPNKLFTHCTDLPKLSSSLHWSFNTTSSSLSIAFTAPPASPNGWIAWAINPTSAAMVGSQALIAFQKPDTTMTVKTFNLTSYNQAKPGKIDFDVLDMKGEFVNGVMRIYATIVLPNELGLSLNQVWQVGGSVNGDLPSIHDSKPDNMNSKGILDLVNGGSEVVAGGDSAGVNSRLRKRNIHGILNVVSWGIMFPFGVIFARYLRTFKSADPAWFYLHAFCQSSSYVIGVAGWGTGLKLGAQSKGITYNTHRNIGIALFCFATLQVFALFLRPKPEHKLRLYWNFYHHGLGYVIVILGIINVFHGLDILAPEQKWKTAYIILLAMLGGFALVLEVITWIVVLKSDKSRKPYDGPNGS